MGADQLQAGVGMRAAPGKPKSRCHARSVAYGMGWTDGRIQVIPLHSGVTVSRYIIIGLARDVAYVGDQTGKGQAQAAGTDGRRAQTGCGWG